MRTCLFLFFLITISPRHWYPWRTAGDTEGGGIHTALPSTRCLWIKQVSCSGNNRALIWGSSSVPGLLFCQVAEMLLRLARLHGERYRPPRPEKGSVPSTDKPSPLGRLLPRGSTHLGRQEEHGLPSEQRRTECPPSECKISSNWVAPQPWSSPGPWLLLCQILTELQAHLSPCLQLLQLKPASTWGP